MPTFSFCLRINPDHRHYIIIRVKSVRSTIQKNFEHNIIKYTYTTVMNITMIIYYNDKNHQVMRL